MGRRIMDRRLFLRDLGRGTAAVAILGITACAADETNDALTPQTTTTGGDAAPTTTAAPTTAAPEATTSTTAAKEDRVAVTVERVDLGFVSAYVLVRAGEAAIVDTGVGGSKDAIEAGLTAVGLDWSAVGDVILTHSHGDHVGSLNEVLTAAASATGYAGEGDIPSIDSVRPLTAVGDGDEVFGLNILETPGHTPGHISVYDGAGEGMLFAGDALNGGDAVGGDAGTVAGPNPEFTPDLATADLSVQKIAVLPFERLYFGHGEPIEALASDQVRQFAASI